MSNYFAAQTPLDRLETALGRMREKHGFQRVDRADAEFPAALSLLLVSEDPQRNPEVLDACVILPEALKNLDASIARLVSGPEIAADIMARFGIARPPSVVFLRDGKFVGTLNGIRDWNEYQAEIERLLTGPAQPRPIGIPLRSAHNGGPCA